VKTGRQIISLPILESEQGNWTPYGVATSLHGSKRLTMIEIYYVNHIQGATCPYNDIFGGQLDPRVEFAKTYSHHIVRETEQV